MAASLACQHHRAAGHGGGEGGEGWGVCSNWAEMLIGCVVCTSCSIEMGSNNNSRASHFAYSFSGCFSQLVCMQHPLQLHQLQSHWQHICTVQQPNPHSPLLPSLHSLQV
jgi:hypothetical protein